MTRPAAPPDLPFSAIPAALPGWITAARPGAGPEAAFRAGAALAHLHQAALRADLPQDLWRARLALAAAETCAALAGRNEGEGALRDACHLTRPGDHPGPAGAVAMAWARAVAWPISVAHLTRALPGLPAARIGALLDMPGSTPVARAAAALQAQQDESPHDTTSALILADAVLSQGIGIGHLLPCLSLTLAPRDLARRGDDLHQACHRAAVAGVAQALSLVADLARRAARLQAVAPRLRARHADRAVALFLSSDALAPADLRPLMSDRAARRLCDRLVALGALRELTGRPSFRLYGL
jgi:hypothetical protein